MYEFTKEEIDQLAYLRALYCLERFKEYLKTTGNFEDSLSRAFPGVEDYECIDSPSV